MVLQPVSCEQQMGSFAFFFLYFLFDPQIKGFFKIYILIVCLNINVANCWVGLPDPHTITP